MAGATLFVILLHQAIAHFLNAILSYIYSASDVVRLVVLIAGICVTSYLKPCKSTIANISLSFHMTLLGILICVSYLWLNYLTVETYTLELTFIFTSFIPHILVALWAGYTLTKHILTRFGYQFHGPGCKVALSDMTNCVRTCVCKRYRRYQEMNTQ